MVDIACGFQNIAVDDAIDQYLEDLFNHYRHMKKDSV